MNDDAQRLIDEGYAAHHEGRRELALEGYLAAAQALRSGAEPLRLAHTVRHVADIQRQLDMRKPSEAHYAEALALYRASSGTPPLDLANTLRGYALLREQCGDLTAAKSMWIEAGQLYSEIGVQAGVDESSRRVEKLDRV